MLFVSQFTRLAFSYFLQYVVYFLSALDIFEFPLDVKIFIELNPTDLMEYFFISCDKYQMFVVAICN